MDKDSIENFRQKLGGRIIYSTVSRLCITIEHDFIVYKVMNEQEAKGLGRYEAAGIAKKELYRLNQKRGWSFSPYNNSVVNRFYKIRKAIRESRVCINLLMKP